MPKCGIYSISHDASGRVYVGSSLDIESRWRSHVNRLDTGTHHNRPLQRDWKKFGAPAFTFSVLELTRALADRELSFIQAFYRPHNNPRAPARVRESEFWRGTFTACEHCGAYMKPGRRRRYCGIVCENEASKYGAHLTLYTCRFCARPFAGERGGRLYCRTQCKVAASKTPLKL